jgi:hypothetical protein
MKKCSIAVLFWALIASSSVYGASHNPCVFRAQAPERHRVVHGDTLWGIAGKFLTSPWCWPRVWDMNHAQIANPHWIYPGQVIVLDKAAGRLRLIGNVDLTKSEAIPTIDMRVITPFLSRSLVISDGELDHAPRVIAGQDHRMHMGTRDRVYVSGELAGQTVFQVLRQGRALLDPDSGVKLGYEALYLGRVALQRAGASDEASAFVVVDARQEIGVGDRLLPVVGDESMLMHAPHAPTDDFQAKVVSTHGGEVYVGQNQVVMINKGQGDQLTIGTVLGLFRTDRSIRDAASNSTMRLPDEQFGSLLVFRVFEQLSYALIMEVSEPVQVGDSVRAPQASRATE